MHCIILSWSVMFDNIHSLCVRNTFYETTRQRCKRSALIGLFSELFEKKLNKHEYSMRPPVLNFFRKKISQFFSRFSISKLSVKICSTYDEKIFHVKEAKYPSYQTHQNYFHITSTTASNLNQSKISWFFHDFSHFKLQSAPTQDKFLDFLQIEFSHSKCFQKVFSLNGSACPPGHAQAQNACPPFK